MSDIWMTPMPSISGMTAAEFARLPGTDEGRWGELARGVVFRHPRPSVKRPQPPRVETATLRTGVITERDPDTIRGPDASYWSNDRLPRGHRSIVYADVPPEFCVEILSEEVPLSNLNERVREYLAAGVRVGWIVDPSAETVAIASSARWVRKASTDRIGGGDALRGLDELVRAFFGQ